MADTPLLIQDAFEASADPAGNEAVLAELWISFMSLLRSHLGALQTTGKLAQAVFSSATPQGLEVADLARTLRLSMQPLSGEGAWSLTRIGVMIGAGVWLLRPDATVVIDGNKAQDMELAVEEFLRSLWKRGPAGAEKLLDLVRTEG